MLNIWDFTQIDNSLILKILLIINKTMFLFACGSINISLYDKMKKSLKEISLDYLSTKTQYTVTKSKYF